MRWVFGGQLGSNNRLLALTPRRWYDFSEVIKEWKQKKYY